MYFLYTCFALDGGGYAVAGKTQVGGKAFLTIIEEGAVLSLNLYQPLESIWMVLELGNGELIVAGTRGNTWSEEAHSDLAEYIFDVTSRSLSISAVLEDSPEPLSATTTLTRY